MWNICQNTHSENLKALCPIKFEGVQFCVRIMYLTDVKPRRHASCIRSIARFELPYECQHDGL
jgi:hypothetical protein